MLKRSMIFFAALCCLTLSGGAQNQKQPCANAQNQQEMNRCAADEYKKTDAELNRVYQQLTPKLEPAHREKLKAAQRAWLAFRDAHCECSAFLFNGGAMQPLIQYTCLDQTTRERIKQLRALLTEVSK
jgi:uncharacterized protein YecT (DUF1311 family)